jgi:hypothetical protein
VHVVMKCMSMCTHQFAYPTWALGRQTQFSIDLPGVLTLDRSAQSVRDCENLTWSATLPTCVGECKRASPRKRRDGDCQCGE